jgi:hypothetical protein
MRRVARPLFGRSLRPGATGDSDALTARSRLLRVAHTVTEDAATARQLFIGPHALLRPRSHGLVTQPEWPFESDGAVSHGQRGLSGMRYAPKREMAPHRPIRWPLLGLAGCGNASAMAAPQADGAVGADDGSDDGRAQPDAQQNPLVDGTALDSMPTDARAGDTPPQAAGCQSATNCGPRQLCVSRITCSMPDCPPQPSSCVDDPCDGGASAACSGLCPTLCSDFAVCSLTADAGTLLCASVPGGV